jgi:hypothetical protein
LFAIARGMDVLAEGGTATGSVEEAAQHAFCGLPITRKGQRSLARMQVQPG